VAIRLIRVIRVSASSRPGGQVELQLGRIVVLRRTMKRQAARVCARAAGES